MDRARFVMVADGTCPDGRFFEVLEPEDFDLIAAIGTDVDCFYPDYVTYTGHVIGVTPVPDPAMKGRSVWRLYVRDEAVIAPLISHPLTGKLLDLTSDTPLPSCGIGVTDGECEACQ